jgi:hypothetical protein
VAQARKPAPAAPASQVLLSTAGAGSAPFQVTGSSPGLKVTYSFSGNSLPGESSGDNFVLYVDSGSDMNLPPTRSRSQAQSLASHVGHRSRPGETTGPLARSGSLLFAPRVSGCHAVNVQLNW